MSPNLTQVQNAQLATLVLLAEANKDLQSKKTALWNAYKEGIQAVEKPVADLQLLLAKLQALPADADMRSAVDPEKLPVELRYALGIHGKIGRPPLYPSDKPDLALEVSRMLTSINAATKVEVAK